jgi:AAA domain
LILGAPKVGKSTIAIATSPGPVLVFKSDNGNVTKSVRMAYPKARFAVLEVHNRAQFENAFVYAKEEVKNGTFRTIVWDTISSFGETLEEECANKTRNGEGEADGRRYWPVYTKFLVNACGRLNHLPCHFIACSHYIDTGGEPMGENPVSKTGPGIVPLLGRAARALVSKEFDDVLFLSKRPMSDERMLLTGEAGVFGPGGRSTRGSHELPARMEAFFKLAGLNMKGIPDLNEKAGKASSSASPAPAAAPVKKTMFGKKG